MITAEKIYTAFEQRHVAYIAASGGSDSSLPEGIFSVLKAVITLANECRHLTPCDHNEFWSEDGYERRAFCSYVRHGLELFGKRPLTLEDRDDLNRMTLCAKYLLEQTDDGVDRWEQIVGDRWPVIEFIDAEWLERAVAAALKESENR